MAAAGPPVQTETRGVGIRGSTGREQGRMWGKGSEWQRWGRGNLSDMVSQPCALVPHSPWGNRQTYLKPLGRDVEEERAELRRRDPAPIHIKMKMELPRGHTVRDLKVAAPQPRQPRGQRQDGVQEEARPDHLYLQPLNTWPDQRSPTSYQWAP